MSLLTQRGNEILRRFGTQYLVMGAEVGVWDGRLSQYLLREHPNLTLLMVDRWAAVPPDHQYAMSGSLVAANCQEVHEAAMKQAKSATAFAYGRAVMLRGESIDIARLILPGSLDFAFIDADHSYEGCLSDIDAWWPSIKEGGWICGHDWDHPEDHLNSKGAKKWGVRKAVLARFPLDRVRCGDNRTWFVQKTLSP